MKKKPIHTGTLNFQWAFSLIHQFYLQGVNHAVISPGSRSTPLALASEKHPEIQTWVQVDERCAAFYALGLAQRYNKPVIVICTSGTAAANWYPAIIEASYSHVPILLLSADRPQELQHCGANQTIDQNYLFGVHVRDFIALEHVDELLLHSNYIQKTVEQAYTTSLVKIPGPVHLNIPFREPLLPRRFTAKDLNTFIQLMAQNIIKSSHRVKTNAQQLLPQLAQGKARQFYQRFKDTPGIMICGRDNFSSNFKNQITRLAYHLNCPVLVDPLSNLRFGPHIKDHLIYNYDTFLKQENETLKPDWVIGFGQFPVSKSLLEFMQNEDAHFILVDPRNQWLDPSRSAKENFFASADSVCSELLKQEPFSQHESWLQIFLKLEKGIEKKIEQFTENSGQLFEAHVIQSLFKLIPNKSMLFSGNSMIIRDLDSFITRQLPTEKAISFYCNRGTSGIDGNLSTYFGLSAHNTFNYNVAVLGDLSFYHDMNGLLIARSLTSLGCAGSIIIVNNHGGGIFNYLPQHQLNDFDKLWVADTRLDFSHAAALYGLSYYRIEEKEQLDNTFSDAFKQPGFNLIEIMINSQSSLEMHKKFLQTD